MGTSLFSSEIFYSAFAILTSFCTTFCTFPTTCLSFSKEPSYSELQLNATLNGADFLPSEVASPTSYVGRFITGCSNTTTSGDNGRGGVACDSCSKGFSARKMTNEHNV